MFKGRGWFGGGGGLRKPKNPHSLEHLKYLHSVLAKNQIVTESNKSLLVETLRAIAEILIWGDQNDGSVFDFFLERNMLSFFLKIMGQRCGSYVCVQLLQTLNILFENIRNETSLYYLLSNNHVNSIIVHKFDFSDEEVLAYYISFLKTLSLKLNKHTIHFFHNEHTNDFPLYTEAIKFFNHSESMVRIAVRTLTLNVYRVEDKSMLKFIRDKTAAPYFSNLVWFIGNHVLELNGSVRQVTGSQSQMRLADLVAEHLDHMHYLNDILCLQIKALNEVLVEHLLQRLLVPLYVYSLTKPHRDRSSSTSFDTDDSGNRSVVPVSDRPRVDSVVSLFLLGQVFLIISHVPLVKALARIIVNGNMDIFSPDGYGRGASPRPEAKSLLRASPPIFSPPAESLEDSLREGLERTPAESGAFDDDDLSRDSEDESCVSSSEPGVEGRVSDINITDEEKEQRLASFDGPASLNVPATPGFTLSSRPFLEAVLNALEVNDNDYSALFTLGLIHSLLSNQGLEDAGFTLGKPLPKRRELGSPSHSPRLSVAELTPDTKFWFSVHLVDRLVKLICSSCFPNSKVRLATLELSVKTLLITTNAGQDRSRPAMFIQDAQLAALEGAKEEATLQLRNFYKGEEIFLDMFEDEYYELKGRPQNVEHLMMDAKLLLPPSPTPMTGIEFSKRLPCGEVERARRAIRVFFLLRELTLTLRGESETELPLTNPQSCIQVDDVLDLNNSDIIGCSMVTKDKPTKIRRYLAIDALQLIVVEPHPRKLGWGVAKFVGFLQDMEATGDREDSRCLHVTFNRSGSSTQVSARSSSKVPVLTAKFLFEDHIRCMAAKQKLAKGRQLARQRKLQQIAKILELPGEVTTRNSASSFSLSVSSAHRFDPRSRRGLHRCNAVDVTVSHSGAGHTSTSNPTDRLTNVRHQAPLSRPATTASPRRMFHPSLQRVPGVATLAVPSSSSSLVLLGGTATTSFVEEPLNPPRNKFNTIRAEDLSPVDDGGINDGGSGGGSGRTSPDAAQRRNSRRNSVSENHHSIRDAGTTSDIAVNVIDSHVNHEEALTSGFRMLRLNSTSDGDSVSSAASASTSLSVTTAHNRHRLSPSPSRRTINSNRGGRRPDSPVVDALVNHDGTEADTDVDSSEGPVFYNAVGSVSVSRGATGGYRGDYRPTTGPYDGSTSPKQQRVRRSSGNRKHVPRGNSSPFPRSYAENGQIATEMESFSSEASDRRSTPNASPKPNRSSRPKIKMRVETV